jgi:alpha-amylase/alpha-mannosidase (GH57 family)
MFFRRKETAVIPESSANVVTIPDVFYAGKNPENQTRQSITRLEKQKRHQVPLLFFQIHQRKIQPKLVTLRDFSRWRSNASSISRSINWL